jgi:hypothetical protein
VRGVVILVWLFSSLALVLVSHEQHQSGQPEQQPVLDWNCGWTIVKKQQQQQEKRVARTVEKKTKQETKISGAKFNWFLLPNSSLDDVAVVELILLLFELFFFLSPQLLTLLLLHPSPQLPPNFCFFFFRCTY